MNERIRRIIMYSLFVIGSAAFAIIFHSVIDNDFLCVVSFGAFFIYCFYLFDSVKDYFLFMKCLKCYYDSDDDSDEKDYDYDDEEVQALELRRQDLEDLQFLADCTYYYSIYPDEDNATCDNCTNYVDEEPYHRCIFFDELA